MRALPLSLVSWLFVSLCLSLPPSALAKPITVAVINQQLSEQLFDSAELESLFKRELLALTEGEFEIRFKAFNAEWNTDSTWQAINAAYADPQVDMIMAVGFLANQLAVTRPSFEKPTFLPLVINPELMGAPVNGNASGKTNLSYLVDSVPFREDLASFYRISPFNNMVLLTDASILEALTMAEQLIKSEAPNINVTFVTDPGSQQGILARIPADTDAIMLAGLPRLNKDELTELLDVIARRGIPVFSQSRAEVYLGALASEAIDADYKRIARRNALNVQAVLLGERASQQPIYYDGRRQLTINMATAQVLGLSPRFDVISEATLINTPQQTGPEFDLRSVAALAIERNLELAIEGTAVEIGQQDVIGVRSNLLPQLNLAASALSRDESPSVRSGVLSERSNDYAATLSQTLYADSLTSAFVQQKYLQQGQEAAYVAVRLDAIQEATIAYLQASRAENELRIQQDNLSLTRANLDLARDRVKVGSASNADIYRWENNLANARTAVLAATSALGQAKQNLNRVLNRPLNAPFILRPARAQEPFSLTESEFNELVNNAYRYERFAQFNVDYGLQIAPELAQIRAQQAAIDRDVLSRKRAFWLPDFSVNAQYTENIGMSGTGSGGPTDGISDWNVTLNATLPLYAGGGRRADLNRSQLQARQLEFQAREIQQRIEQSIRAAILDAQASYASIELSQAAASAARNSLDLVSDGYRVGTIGIIDLLDAQNQALLAELSANNAVQDFLIDAMNLQRAIGQFEFLLPPQQQSEFNDALRAYVNTPPNGSSK